MTARTDRQSPEDDKRADAADDVSEPCLTSEPETTDAKTASNMKAFHRAFERRRR